jgi:serine protease AprX
MRKGHRISDRIRMILIVCCFSPLVAAQEIAEGVDWVYFTDKMDNGYEVDHPEAFLSGRSITRRAWQGLGVDLSDEPVSKAYVDSLKAMGVEILHVSRWLNGVAMVHPDSQLTEELLALSFVDTLPWSAETDAVYYPPRPSGSRFDAPLASPPDFQYGIAREQILQVDMEVLHQKGYTGGGVWIGVLDGGFRNVDSLPSFVNMIDQGRLLGTRNFVNDSSVFRLVNNHGMYVLSIIGGEWNGNMMGTAPHASFYLCSTENVHQETRIEEIAWIEAAEYVDSLGCDVINTSLGYSDFDGLLHDYTYRDMDGQRTYVSRAASMLADKGIIACVSAGNEGNQSWYRITAPSDAYNILCVGAVDRDGIIAGFSSRGPSYDGRVKPDVVAMGSGTGIQYGNGNLAIGAGTSFSSPVMAGSVAALWQAYPEMSARELILSVRESGNRFDNPDATYGYGVPSLARTFWGISSSPLRSTALELELYPNPARERIMIRLPDAIQGVFILNYYDLSGALVQVQAVSLPGEVILPSGLRPGFYVLELHTASTVFRNRLIIQ